MNPSIPSLTLVVDRRLYRPHKNSEPLSLVEAAIAGGVTMVQMRVPHGDSDGDLSTFAIALRLREMTAGKVPFVITGDLHLAEKCHADGILLTDRAYRPDEVRKFLRGSMTLVGCYVQSVPAAARAERGGADYVQAGPAFVDRADSEEYSDGLSLVRKVKDAIHLPVIAFGGIATPERARAALEVGANGVAVTNAVLSAQDPTLAARMLASVVAG